MPPTAKPKPKKSTAKSKPAKPLPKEFPPSSNPLNAETIFLPKVSLGNLVRQYKPTQTVQQIVTTTRKRLRSQGKFLRISHNPANPHTLLYGFDGAILAYRISSGSEHRNTILSEAVKVLPQPKNSEYRGIDRGKYTVRHYCIWSPYNKTPFVSAQFKADGESAEDFMRQTTSIWETMSDNLKCLFPAIYREFTKYPLPEGLSRMADAFSGIVVNMHTNEGPVETEPHRDVKERKFGMSCLSPFGEYEGGHLVLWELETVIELAPGDQLFFRDSLINHSNESVTDGVRNSVVAFTQQSMFDYWRRQNGRGVDQQQQRLNRIKKRQKAERKEKRKTKNKGKK